MTIGDNMNYNPPDYNMDPPDYWDTSGGIWDLNADELVWLQEFRDECACKECMEHEQPCDTVWEAFNEGVA